MLTVISPAKRLDWEVPRDGATQPAMQDQANLLAERARALSHDDLKRLMGLSDELTKLNTRRFRDMAETSMPENSRPAALAFAGDTYQGLEAATLEDHARAFAQDRLRILSGLYGVLRPWDAIQPYRLEMGSKLETERGRDLYAFWGDRIARALNADADATGSEILLNCASQEYMGAVDKGALTMRIVTPKFLDEKNGTPKVIAFHAKRARGAMARFVCENRLTDPEALRDFDLGEYAYDPSRSTPDAPAFLRSEAARRVA